MVISDKTVQVPEYLGGGRYHVNVNQIVQTSGQQTNEDTPIGETGAMSVTPVNESSFTKSFEEHGFVIGVCCVRHNHSYQQGLERFWSRTDRLDYYVPQFANLGEQPVKKKEIMLTGSETDEETFGYQEAWADYRRLTRFLFSLPAAHLSLRTVAHSSQACRFCSRSAQVLADSCDCVVHNIRR